LCCARFDLLHVMLDELTEEEDGRIAAHIVALHKDPAATISRAPFTMEQLQRYIKYARAIKPRLTAAVSGKSPQEHFLLQQFLAAARRLENPAPLRQSKLSCMLMHVCSACCFC
jgi:hypothetical protein